jgi:ferrous iron transport protein A
MSDLQRLSALQAGQSATIQAIHTDSSGFHFRLNALGFRTGKTLLVIRVAPFNGPMHLRLGNTEVMLRQQDAKMIEVLI